MTCTSPAPAPLKKGARVTYKSHYDHLYTAVILRAHRDGSVTLRIGFPIRDGKPLEFCFQGDVYRVDPATHVVQP